MSGRFRSCSAAGVIIHNAAACVDGCPAFPGPCCGRQVMPVKRKSHKPSKAVQKSKLPRWRIKCRCTVIICRVYCRLKSLRGILALTLTRRSRTRPATWPLTQVDVTCGSLHGFRSQAQVNKSEVRSALLVKWFNVENIEVSGVRCCDLGSGCFCGPMAPLRLVYADGPNGYDNRRAPGAIPYRGKRTIIKSCGTSYFRPSLSLIVR